MKNKMPYRLENNLIKGEMACYMPFLLFSQWFPFLTMVSTAIYIYVRKNAALCGNGITELSNHHKQIQSFAKKLHQ